MGWLMLFFQGFLSIIRLHSIQLLGRGFPLCSVMGKMSHGEAERSPQADLGGQPGLLVGSPTASSKVFWTMRL